MIRSLIVLMGLASCSFAEVIVSLRAFELSRDLAGTLTQTPEKAYDIALQAIKQQQAREVETLLVAAHETFFVQSESFVELIYPTDFVADELPETKREKAPENPSISPRPLSYLDFIVFSVGTKLQAKATLAKHNHFLLDIEYSRVTLHRWKTFPNQHANPEFQGCTMNTKITIPQSTWQFMGFRDTWRAESPVGAKVAFFVRVDPLN